MTVGYEHDKQSTKAQIAITVDGRKWTMHKHTEIQSIYNYSFVVTKSGWPHAHLILTPPSDHLTQ